MKKLTVLATILLTAACTTNPTNTSGTSSSGGNTPGGGDNSSGGDGSGGDKPGDGDGTEATKSGSIMVTQSSYSVAGNDMFMYSTMASFVDATGSTVGTTNGVKCTQSTDGDCSISECDLPSGSGNETDAGNGTPGEAKKQPTAGDITISGLEDVTMSPDGNGAYTAKSGQVALFEGGADVTFKAAGAEVPAFEKVLKAPSSVTLTAPAWPAPGTALEIDRSKDLDLTWDNGTAGDVQASISSLAGQKTATITCKFKADAGQGKISKAALGKLVATDTGSISVSAMSSESFDQGGWKLSVMALAPASAGSASAAGSAKIK